MPGLTKVQIHFWEQCGNKYTFRAEYVIDGYMNYEVGDKSGMRILLSMLRSVHHEDLPKVNWKKLIGTEDEGGEGYHWVRK